MKLLARQSPRGAAVCAVLGALLFLSAVSDVRAASLSSIYELKSNSAGWKGAADCVPKYKEYILDVLVAVDHSRSYAATSKEMREKWFPAVSQALLKRYPRSLFGLMTFNDWAKRTWWVGSYCYKLQEVIWPGSDRLYKAWAGLWSQPAGDAPQSSLAGITIGLTDKAIGWNQNKIELDGARRRKVMVAFTNAEPLLPGTVSGPLMSGRFGDSCDCDAPSAEMLGRFLRQNDDATLVLVVDGDRALKTWRYHARKMGNAKVIVVSSKEAQENVVNAIQDAIEEFYCFDPTTTSTRKNEQSSDNTSSVSTEKPGGGGKTEPSGPTPNTPWNPELPDVYPSGADDTEDDRKSGPGAGIYLGAATGGVAALACAYGGWRYVQQRRQRAGLLNECSPLDDLDNAYDVESDSSGEEEEADIENDREQQADTAGYA